MAILRTLPSGDHGDDDSRRAGSTGGRRDGSQRPPAAGRSGLVASARSASPAADLSPSTWAAAVDVAALVIDLSDALDGERPGARSRCRPPSRDELAWIAAIHARALPGGFFVRFGRRFLARYHDSFRTGPFAVALVAGPPGEPRGFVVGTWDNPRHYRWLLRHVGPLARSGLGAMLLRPRLAYEVVTTRFLRYARSAVRILSRRATSGSSSGSASGSSSGTTSGPSSGATASPATASEVGVVAVLTHVAVAAGARGTGLGRELVDAFVREARTRGATEVRLIAHVSTPAPGFYRRLGWSSLGERRASDGTIVEEFQLVL